MAPQLIVTFLYGEFHAHVVTDRSVTAEWIPGAKDRSHGWHEGAFRYYLERAIEETGFSGEEVSLVVEDPDLEHMQVSLPPVKKKSRLVLLLENEVTRHVGDESSAWSYTPLAAAPDKEEPAKPRSGQEHYLLHLWPTHKLNRYLDDFQYVGLAPRLVVPYSPLLLDKLQELNRRNRPAALLKRYGYGAILLLHDRDKPSVLLRHLTGGLGKDAGKIVQEIRRSLLYANQNMALQPAVLWLDGKDLLLAAQSNLELTVKEAEEWNPAQDIVLPVARLGVFSSANLLPWSIREQHRWQLIHKVTNYITGCAVALAIAATGVSQWLVMQTGAERETLSQHIQLQSEESQNLEKELNRLEQRRAMIEFASGDKQPIIEWFLQDLARSAPQELMITELSVTRQDNTQAELLMKAELNASDLRGLDKSLLDFGQSLQGEPWFVRLPNGWANTWRQNYMSGAMANGSHKVPLAIQGTLPW